MATLAGQSIATSYEQLLSLPDGGGDTTNHVAVTDGDGGTTFPITLATDAIMITSTNRLEFGDDASYIHQSADGVLDLVSDTEIELNATTIDINGDVDISGSITNAAWTGDVIASAYLDTDTAHLSGSQTFSGEKTFSANIIMADDTSIGISDSAERIEFDGAGDISVLGANFGIGTDAPEAQVEIQGSSSASYAAGTVALTNTGTLFIQNTDNTAAAFSQIVFGTRVSSVALSRIVSINVGSTDSDLAFVCNNSEAMRIDGSTGNVGIGTNNPLTKLHVADTSSMKYENNQLTLTRDGGHLMVLLDSGDTIGDGEGLGYYRFNGKVGANDEVVGAEIRAEADGAWTADTDCPTRMVFRQNSGSGTQEVMRISKGGSLLIGKTTDTTATANAISLQVHNGASESGQAPAVFSKGNAGHALIGQGQSAGVEDCVYFSNTSTSWGGATKGIIKIEDANSGASTSNFMFCVDADGTEARLDTNGLYYGSGTAVSAIDYAEFFESKDGKAIDLGTTVKLDGDKIVPCSDGDTPIGVIRPNEGSSVLGGNSLQWSKKYKRTDYDAYETEDYEVIEWEVTEVVKEAYTDENGDKHEAVTESHFEQCEKGKEPEGVEIPSNALVVKKTRRIVNSDYDSSKTYVERKDRDEWNLVGLLGQVPITKGQPIASNWIKMKDVSDTVEMYLIK
mgnify:CR=1 FL=1